LTSSVGGLKLEVVTWSRKASTCLSDKALCKVSRGLIVAFPSSPISQKEVPEPRLGEDDDPLMTAVENNCDESDPEACLTASSSRNLR